MLTNLFNSFDPSTTLFIQWNWLSMIIVLTIMPNKFWLIESRNSMMKTIFKNFIDKEMKFIYFNKQLMMNLQSSFIYIMIMNLCGLIPYMFTPTSHLSISMALGLPIWLSLMTFSWLNHTNMMFIHLLPMSTPSLMAPLMILVESLSNLIRPISLSVRLTANMIAGHLLMTLLGNVNEMKTISLIFMFQVTLMMFEITVALIQAYVFTILLTMYSSEIP
uniref:ATP synthase subunit a n=1 Tax=Changeondelphax velitchkovskyi TaxID=1291384 RepID=A0A343UJB2_9HEMI|nr:ATP synthase F0 subunit 6 [Changeondelphax velitchkovskyi]AVC55490.1 ATP synthase F0 subunit 6 [Changeondelphax velitchkovskyi]